MGEISSGDDNFLLLFLLPIAYLCLKGALSVRRNARARRERWRR